MLTDDSPMPFGKHKGVPMKDVPASYLLWLDDNANNLSLNMITYISENRQGLEMEVQENETN